MNFTWRPFNLKTDETFLRALALMREEEVPETLSFLPPTGFIVFHEEAPVCLGFLIKCDNNMAIISDSMSDPAIQKDIRNEAVEFLRALQFTAAKEAGLQFVTGFTKHEKLAKRLEDFGFKRMFEGYIQMGRFLWL